MFRVSAILGVFLAASAVLASPPSSDSPVKFPLVELLAQKEKPEPKPEIAPMPKPKGEPECCDGGGAAPAGDMADRKLGRAKPKQQDDIGHFRMVVGQDGKARYFVRLGKHIDLSKRSAPFPASINWGTKAPTVIKRVYLNDQYGDCVIASRYHGFGILSANDTGGEVQGTDSEVLASYQSACGRGDNGCDMSAVNQYLVSKGFLLSGKVHKIDGVAALDNSNADIVKSALCTFGYLYVGMELPSAWYSSADGADWGVTNTRIVGGHEVGAFGYDDKGVWIATWGGTRRILWAAFQSSRWIDELYVPLAPDWYGSDNLAPNGIDVTTLKADLALIANGQIPPLPTPNPPTPPTPPGPIVPPTPPAPSALGSVTVDPATGTITALGPWKLKGTSSVPSLAAELLEAGVSQDVVNAVLVLIKAAKKKSALPVRRREWQGESILAA